MILQIIGYVISLVIVGAICGAIAYLYGWEKGWDDSKHFIHTTLDALSDEGIILVVREMAKKFREEGAKERRMGKLIDVDVAIRAAVEYIEDWNRAKSIYHRRELTKKFIALPPVDAVSVVRCKDCKFYYQMTAETGICELACRHLGNDGFCSEGERYESVES